MKTYQEIKTVTTSDLDELNHVNNVRYVQWIQDIAKAHWFKASTTEMNENFVWVVASHHIEYKSSALLNDHIIIKTFVEKSEGITSTRIVEMYHKDTQKLIVKASTVWCLLNAKTFKPARITEDIKTLFC